MEKYSGIKFQVIFLREAVLYFPQIDDLKKWGKRLSELGFIQHYKNETEPNRLSSAGNLSFRYDNRFIITASYSDLADLRDEDFVEVEKVDLKQRKIYVNGFREPSSETMLHSAIYQKRSDVNAILHAHGQKLLRNYEKLGLKSTKYFAPYGSMQLVNSVIEVLGNENFLIMKYHGFLSLGDTTNNAGKYVEDVYKRLMEIY